MSILGRLYIKLSRVVHVLQNYILFSRTGIIPTKLYRSGLPQIKCIKSGRIIQANIINMVNDAQTATLGNPRRCKFLVYDNAVLNFRGIVSMSNTVIVCTKSIELGNNVMIGSGSTIIDCNFHSMNYSLWNTPEDEKQMKSENVVIGDNVFLGMDTLILKGVHIGNGAIIAARSVINRDVPPNEIWGGNPAIKIGERK